MGIAKTCGSPLRLCLVACRESGLWGLQATQRKMIKPGPLPCPLEDVHKFCVRLSGGRTEVTAPPVQE